MNTVRYGLVVLPLATLLLTWYAVRPIQPVVAPRRLAAARASVLVGAYGVGSVEALSALHRLTVGSVVAVWLLAVAGATAAALLRRRRSDQRQPLRVELGLVRPALGRVEWTVVGVLSALVGAELALALAAPPNTYDSQTYHLPRIESWVQQASVELFPTAIHRQITYPPGAEFLLLHLRLLTGGDAAYNLLQWSAGVLCLVLVTRLGAQFGLARRAQLLGALVAGSVPMVVLQSSSTQTDLTVAGWVVCVVTMALDGVGRQPLRRPDAVTVLFLAAAAGLVAVTKATGALVVGPMLVWWVFAQLRRDAGPDRARRGRLVGVGRVAAASLVILIGVAALAGPQLWRIFDAFGHPLGPQTLRASLTVQQRDPASLLVNGLRQAHTLFEVPAPPLNRWAADAVIGLAHALGRDPSDPDTTFYQQVFPDESWYPHEDKGALPLHALLLVMGAVAALRYRPDRRRAGYVAVLAVAVLAFAMVFKWQPWGNRLVLFIVIPAAPLAGAWLDQVLDGGRRLARGVTAVALVVAAAAGLLSAGYGYPRRLVGADSALIRDDWSQRFAIRPEWATSYVRAADAVKATGARRIGTAALNDHWEYPWWLLFEGRDLRSLQSPAPGVIPPARFDEVDAMVCAAPGWYCHPYIPPGFVFQHDGVVGWALPAKP